jgi:hypothetical protein
MQTNDERKEERNVLPMLQGLHHSRSVRHSTRAADGRGEYSDLVSDMSVAVTPVVSYEQSCDLVKNVNNLASCFTANFY